MSSDIISNRNTHNMVFPAMKSINLIQMNPASAPHWQGGDVKIMLQIPPTP